MRSQAYNTVGKQTVIKYMAQNSERQFSVDELYDKLKEAGSAVGKSSLYRLLERMVSDGAVRKFKESECASAVFQYIGSDAECSHHLHLKCSHCGKLVHLECQNSIKLIEHVYKEHGFSIDSKKSVLYGMCSKCQEQSRTGE